MYTQLQKQLSFRRIANALLLVSTLSLSINMLSSLSLQCSIDSSQCLAAAWMAYEPTPYVTDMSIAHYTPPAGSTVAVSDNVHALVQAVGLYALFIAVGILVILECFELYYIRALFTKSRSPQMRRL